MNDNDELVAKMNAASRRIKAILDRHSQGDENLDGAVATIIADTLRTIGQVSEHPGWEPYDHFYYSLTAGEVILIPEGIDAPPWKWIEPGEYIVYDGQVDERGGVKVYRNFDELPRQQIFRVRHQDILVRS